MNTLPMIDLKTKQIFFDDRLQQCRIITKTKNGHGPIRFLNYNDDDGFYYMKKYRPNEWMSVINV
jgi:hypothetical protein